jgi:profilin
MSGWMGYVDSLVKSKGCTKAGLFGNNGKPWAITKGWAVTDKEVLHILSGFTDKTKVQATAPTVAGTKCMCVKVDEVSIYGKAGKSGFCAAKTIKGVIVGWYDDPIQPGQCNVVVEKMMDDLKNKNY